MCSCQGAGSLTLLFQTQVSKMKARRERRSNKIATISGGNDGEVPPVPIPNTEVKLSSAESTWLDTAREDKSLPDSIILSSSMAEHSAVNRVVVGSSPTWGAIRSVIYGWSFCLSAFACPSAPVAAFDFSASCVIISITSYKRTVDALRIEGLLSILL